jgi:hypothetical protein
LFGKFALVLACHAAATGENDGVSFQSPETRLLANQIGDLLQKCKDVARNIKMGQSSTVLLSLDSLIVPPFREFTDSMVTLYFHSFESVHRILHSPSFWTEYGRYWNSPDSASIPLRLKICLVIAIGSSVAEHDENQATLRDTIRQWIHAAQSWLSGPLKKDRLDIAGLQIYCLTILARQVFSVGGDLVWISTGSLIHRAMQIGLHRDPKHFPGMSILQAEVRRRLWATILEMAVQSSLDSAMPPRISFDEFDTEPPSNCNDDELDESITAIQSHPRAVYTATSLQLLLLDSLPIRLKILRLLNGLHSELSYLEVLALSSELTEADRASTNSIINHEESGVTPFHRNMLHYFVRRFMLPLHCPFASSARTNPLFYYSIKASMDAAIAIISPEKDAAFSHILALGGGLFREGVRVATSAISQELIAQAESQRMDGTLHRKSQFRGFLKKAVTDIIALSIERIKQGETNVKLHMLMSMILAQAEAIENGASEELMVAQSARDSLEYCHGLLCTLASNVSQVGMDLTPTELDAGQESYGVGVDFDFFFSDGGFA